MIKSMRNQLFRYAVLFTSCGTVISCGRDEAENAPLDSTSGSDAASSQGSATRPAASGNTTALDCSGKEQNPLKATLHAWACEKIAREKNEK